MKIFYIFLMLYLMQLFFTFVIIVIQDSVFKPIHTKKIFYLCLIPFLIPLYLLYKVIMLVVSEIKKLD